MLMRLEDGLLLAYFFALGATIGSFLNVVIARLPAGESIIKPRSRCPQCKTQIAWYDNVPLLSYLVLRARCRHCGGRIAARYFVVELLMASLSVALWSRFGLSWDLAIWLPLAAALLAIVFLDIDHWWVPDVITFPAAIFVGLASFLPGGLAPLDALLGLSAAVLAFSVAWCFKRVTGREGLGLGDVKLLAVLGLAMGLSAGLSVLVLGAAQGALVGVVVLLTGGHRGADSSKEAEGTDSSERADGSSHTGGSSADRAAGSSADRADGSSADGADGSSANQGDDEDDWVPPPRAIPFGPFLVIAAYEIVLLPSVFDDLPRRLFEAVMELM